MFAADLGHTHVVAAGAGGLGEHTDGAGQPRGSDVGRWIGTTVHVVGQRAQRGKRPTRDQHEERPLHHLVGSHDGSQHGNDGTDCEAEEKEGARGQQLTDQKDHEGPKPDPDPVACFHPMKAT